MAKIAVYKSDGTHVFNYDISLGGQNYAPEMKEAYELARKAAVEDGLVTDAEGTKLTFKVVG